MCDAGLHIAENTICLVLLLCWTPFQTLPAPQGLCDFLFALRTETSVVLRCWFSDHEFKAALLLHFVCKQQDLISGLTENESPILIIC